MIPDAISMPWKSNQAPFLSGGNDFQGYEKIPVLTAQLTFCQNGWFSGKGSGVSFCWAEGLFLGDGFKDFLIFIPICGNDPF